MTQLQPVTHIAGMDITIAGRRLRQRCAWCGAILIDSDLANVATVTERCSHGCDRGQILVPPGDDEPCPHCNGTGNEPFVMATYPPGRLVRVEGEAGFRSFVVLDEADDLPDDACGKVDDAVTGLAG